jgi:hypothetical protein
LAKLLRAGEFTAVWVADEGHEAMRARMRDLARARAAAVETLRVHRQQVSASMLKHGRVFPRKKGWTMRFLRCEQQFEHPAHQIALQEIVEAVRTSSRARLKLAASCLRQAERNCYPISSSHLL